MPFSVHIENSKALRDPWDKLKSYGKRLVLIEHPVAGRSIAFASIGESNYGDRKIVVFLNEIKGKGWVLDKNYQPLFDSTETFLDISDCFSIQVIL